MRDPKYKKRLSGGLALILAFCSARGLELESVKAYHVGAWLDRHPGSRDTWWDRVVLVHIWRANSPGGQPRINLQVLPLVHPNAVGIDVGAN